MGFIQMQDKIYIQFFFLEIQKNNHNMNVSRASDGVHCLLAVNCSLTTLRFNILYNININYIFIYKCRYKLCIKQKKNLN
jgi:hypothetical protein